MQRLTLFVFFILLSCSKDSPIPDTTSPTITLTGSSTINLTVGDTFADPGATAEDSIDGDITSLITSSGTVDTSTEGTYTTKYSVSDAAGNSVSTTRTVIVNPLPDTTSPTITLTGSSTINLTVGDTFADPGATATDNIDGDITSSIITSGTLDTSSTGSYTISYSISDATGNSASVTRTVVVVEDHIELNIRIHLMQSEAWIHPLGSEMNMWVTESDVRQTIIPEMNLIWSQASIEWKVEGIINEPIVEYTGFEEDVEYIINSKRDDEGRSDKARLPLLYNLMNPSYLSSEIELEKNLFHIYIFPFIGNTSQGNAMRPFGFHSVVGCWTNKHNGGGNPQKTLLTEPHSEIDRGSLARTISHELGHVLGLSHSCINCLMYSKGYELNTSQIIISTEEARRRGGM